jgi:hypothetical protein
VLIGFSGNTSSCAAGQAVSLRLCLRELRQADVAATIRDRTRHRLPHAR